MGQLSSIEELAFELRRRFATVYHRISGHVCVSIDSAAESIIFNEWVQSFQISHDVYTGDRLVIVTFVDGSDKEYSGDFEVLVSN